MLAERMDWDPTDADLYPPPEGSEEIEHCAWCGDEIPPVDDAEPFCSAQCRADSHRADVEDEAYTLARDEEND